MRFRLLMVALVLCSFIPKSPKKIIFFGDSITFFGEEPGGYIRDLDSILHTQAGGRNYELVGAGIRGDNVADLYLRLDQDVISKRPDVVVIWIGVNDVWQKQLFRTGVQKGKFEEFYEAIIKKLKAEHIKVILCTPASIGEKKDFENSQDAELNDYCQVIRKLSVKESCVLVDLRQDFADYLRAKNGDNKDKGVLTEDGVHLNSIGNWLAAEKLLPALTGVKQSGGVGGVRFEDGLSWAQVLAKAKQENKYVLVDCYASWCGPCKSMDQNVYPDPQLGEFVNNHYVSFKAQMDSSALDGDEIKAGYRDAHQLMESYQISAYPTFLFFSPEGVMVHKVVGGYPADNFIEVASDALNPKKQFYTLNADYRNGKRTKTSILALVKASGNSGDKALTQEIAEDYLGSLSKEDLQTDESQLMLMQFGKSEKVQKIVFNYLQGLSKDELGIFTNRELMNQFQKNEKVKQISNAYISGLISERQFSKDNINFFYWATISSKDAAFDLLYNHSEMVDSIMETPGHAERRIEGIISKEEIINSPEYKSSKPDWKKMIAAIERKYNRRYAERAVTISKVFWYVSKNDWDRAFDANIAYIDKFTPEQKGNSQAMNALGCNLFKYGVNKKQLDWGVRCLKEIAEKGSKDVNFLDTYSVLLYKSGRTAEGIEWEKRTLGYAEEQGIKSAEESSRIAIDKMEKGEKIWLDLEVIKNY